MIREVLDNLTEYERRVLIHSFENDIPQHIEVSKGRFVGVHLDPKNQKYNILESCGVWSIGELNKNE